MNITREVAEKVLTVVDAGLVSGIGNPKPGEMCVEAAVCFALGLPHGDDPACVSRALRQLKIKLNDANWSSDKARAKGLRRLAVAQLGSASHLDDAQFVKRVAEYAIRDAVPRAMRAAASVVKNAERRAEMVDAANRCEKEGTRASALNARRAADAYAAAAAANAANDAARRAGDAAAYAADAAANAVAYATDAAAATAAAAANAADAAAATAAAADAVADGTTIAKTRDEELSLFAEGVVQILIQMGAPGCQWLELTEAP